MCAFIPSTNRWCARAVSWTNQVVQTMKQITSAVFFLLLFFLFLNLTCEFNVTDFVGRGESVAVFSGMNVQGFPQPCLLRLQPSRPSAQRSGVGSLDRGGECVHMKI